MAAPVGEAGAVVDTEVDKLGDSADIQVDKLEDSEDIQVDKLEDFVVVVDTEAVPMLDMAVVARIHKDIRDIGVVLASIGAAVGVEEEAVTLGGNYDLRLALMTLSAVKDDEGEWQLLRGSLAVFRRIGD